MNLVFLAHWSAAFVEEQFYALYLAMSTQLAEESSTCLSVTYFCEWHNQCAVNHLIDCLFAPLDNNNTAARDTRHYPPTTSNDAHHQLAHCTADNTLFVVYFPPRHLAFFLASTGNRFARRYVWWQAEQASRLADCGCLCHFRETPTTLRTPLQLGLTQCALRISARINGKG